MITLFITGSCPPCNYVHQPELKSPLELNSFGVLRFLVEHVATYKRPVRTCTIFFSEDKIAIDHPW